MAIGNPDSPQTPRISAPDDDPLREREGGDRNREQANDAGVGADDDDDEFDDTDEEDEEEVDEEEGM